MAISEARRAWLEKNRERLRKYNREWMHAKRVRQYAEREAAGKRVRVDAGAPRVGFTNYGKNQGLTATATDILYGDGLFSEFVLPCQLPRREPTSSPESQLFAAVLELAWWDYRRKPPKRVGGERYWRKRAERESLISWVTGDPAPVPFELACAAAGLDAEAVRARYLQMAACVELAEGLRRLHGGVSDPS